MYYCCGTTDMGTVRNNNEDAYLVNKIVLSQAQMESDVTPPFIAAVADGVGGEASGEVASKLALELLSGVKPNKKTNFGSKLMSIHNKLRRYGITHGGSENMQTTLCALAVDENDKAYIINVGDSRMYRFRDGEIRQLSKDQSLVQLLYEQGRITGDERRSHAQKNVIFPVLGNISDDPVPDIIEIEGGIKKGDLIIICTDGLSDYITKGEFEEALAQPMKLSKRLRLLIDTAMENGSRDNATAVAVCVI